MISASRKIVIARSFRPSNATKPRSGFVRDEAISLLKVPLLEARLLRFFQPLAMTVLDVLRFVSNYKNEEASAVKRMILIIISLLFVSPLFSADFFQIKSGSYEFKIYHFRGGEKTPGELRIEEFYNGNKVNEIKRDGTGFTPVDAQARQFIEWEDSRQLLIFVASDGSGSYGQVFGYSFNKNEWKEILTNKLNLALPGYMGHDTYFIKPYKDSYLICRKFPLYKKSDPNCCPTGGTMLMKYEYETIGYPQFVELKAKDKK